MKRRFLTKQAGLTLMEMLVSTAIGSACLGMAYIGLMSGIELIGKNMAVNLTTLQTRYPLEMFVKDLQESVSVPELIDANFALYQPVIVTGADGGTTAISGTSASPGVRFQVPKAGPYRVSANVDANATVVKLEVGNEAPSLGGDALHLVIPTHRIDVPLASVALSGTILTCNLKAGKTIATGTGTYIKTTTSNGSKLNVGAYITVEKRYYVKDGNFYLSEGEGEPRLLSRRVLTAKPFSRPTGRSVGVLFATSNAEYDQRKYANSDVLYQFEINFRGQLYQ